ncbi:MAG: LLM class flavin-dependent oxidoreductase [Promethearchaeota archaeon]
MKFGISIRNMDKFADFDNLIALALDAEDAGWDGIFLWDHLLHKSKIQRDIIDPWIALSAIAANTKKILLGPLITPITRRRPWKVAKEAVSLDHLSKGRLILGVGLGWPPYNDFERFGDEGDARIRGEMLDEGLDIMEGLWSGKPFGYDGVHYQIREDTVFLPKPYGGKSRIPIWVGGGAWSGRKKPFRRAARFDGCTPSYSIKDGEWGARHFAAIAGYIQQFRQDLDGFEFVTWGQAPRKKDKVVPFFNPMVQGGIITWWIEKVYSWPGDIEAIRRKLRKGPPSL